MSAGGILGFINSLFSQIKGTGFDSGSHSLKNIKDGIDTISEYTDTLETAVASVKSDTNSIKGYTDALETDTAILKADTATLKSDTTTIKGYTDTIETGIGDIKGSGFSSSDSLKSISSAVSKTEGFYPGLGELWFTTKEANLSSIYAKLGEVYGFDVRIGKINDYTTTASGDRLFGVAGMIMLNSTDSKIQSLNFLETTITDIQGASQHFGFGAVIVGNKIYLSRWIDPVCYVYEYSLAGRSLTQKAQLETISGSVARYGVYGQIGGNLYFYGGFASSNTLLKKYIISSNTVEDKASAPSTVGNCYGGVLNDRYLFLLNKSSNTILCYDSVNNSWSSSALSGMSTSTTKSMCVHNGLFYLIDPAYNYLYVSSDASTWKFLSIIPAATSIHSDGGNNLFLVNVGASTTTIYRISISIKQNVFKQTGISV